MTVPWLVSVPPMLRAWPARVTLAPGWMVRLSTEALMSSSGQRPRVGWLGIVTLTPAPGTVCPDQFAGLLHAVLTAPVQVTLAAATVSVAGQVQAVPSESLTVIVKLYMPGGVV